MGTPSLLVALDHLELLAEVRPEKLEPAAVRWHGRLEVEAAAMTLAESQLALAALASLCAGEREAVEIPAAAAAPGQAHVDAASLLRDKAIPGSPLLGVVSSSFRLPTRREGRNVTEIVRGRGLCVAVLAYSAAVGLAASGAQAARSGTIVKCGSVKGATVEGSNIWQVSAVNGFKCKTARALVPGLTKYDALMVKNHKAFQVTLKGLTCSGGQPIAGSCNTVGKGGVLQGFQWNLS
jgi:hypothetical protein